MAIAIIMRKDIALMMMGSKTSPDLATIFTIIISILVVANKITANSKEKENDFLTPQKIDNIKNTNSKSTQNNGFW